MNPRQNRPNNLHCHFSLPGRSSMKYIFKLQGASLQQEVHFEALKTTGTPHTSENLADIVKEQKLECEATYNVKIGSLVCDNAANMVRMRKILTNDIGVHEKCPGSHKEFVVRRMNMAISPAVMAANVLDHRYQGSKLTSIEMTAAIDYIKNYSPGAFPQVMIYMAKEAPFSSNLFGKDYENISATSWWKTGRRLGFPDDLVNVALPLVAAASSSAGLERQFSTLGFTYGTLRAQLGVEKAGKIAFLYRELNK